MNAFFSLLERDVRERDALPFLIAPPHTQKMKRAVGDYPPGSVIVVEVEPHGANGHCVLHGIRLISKSVGIHVVIDETAISNYTHYTYCNPDTLEDVPGLHFEERYFPTFLSFMTLSTYATARNQRPWAEAGCVPLECVWRRDLPLILPDTRDSRKLIRGLAAEHVEAAGALQRMTTLV